MHKELISISLIKKYLVSKKVLANSANNIVDMYSFFKYLTSPENKKKFNSLYILNYINQYIVSDGVAKRKTSARVFEDLLAILFGGIVTDSEERKNLVSEVPKFFNLAKDKVAGNKREKIDLLFGTTYGVSVKTLMQDNKEINLGSFERKVLFDGFGVENFLVERKSNQNIGLGSKPQLLNLLTLLKKNGLYGQFETRFKAMFSYIFSDDMIIAIKDRTKLELYFFSGDEFTSFVNQKTRDIELFLSVLNRWEGNSIRIDRTKLLQNCSKKLILDLGILDSTVIPLINKFDQKLHENYIMFFNESGDRLRFKRDTLAEIDGLFSKFDREFLVLR
jgi:hypothetical protein